MITWERSARALASSLGLIVDDAIVLQDSNKLTLRLLPCDVVARIAPAEQQNAEFELALAIELGRVGGPVAAPAPGVEPRVHPRDGVVITLWTHQAAVSSPELSPAAYAEGLARLHGAMRTVDLAAPHVTDRVESAQQLVASRDLTPGLADADRELLADTLTRYGRIIGECGGQQLLHGEPHPGNVINTVDGPVFIDLETCCRGPVEFDLAHAPAEIVEHYPGVDHELLAQCRILMLAMITTWRWDVDDVFPNGPQLGRDWLAQLRRALAETC